MTMNNNDNLTGLRPERFQTLIEGHKTDLYVLQNKNGMEVCITNYGGIVLSILAPDSHGEFKNVVIGFDSIDDAILQSNQFYIGAIIGPVAGRVLHGAFCINGKTYQLPMNSLPNLLHSGKNGFHTKVWKAKQLSSNQIQLTHTHYDGEDGFPGNMLITVMYTLTESNSFRIEYEAVSDQDTLFNPTHHAYFNLAGTGNPTSTIENHKMMIDADFYLPIDEHTNNTGEILTVNNTPFDFRQYHTIGERIHNPDIQLQYGHGYDHCFVLRKTTAHELSHAATCISPECGRKMDVYTTEPGLIMYTGNYLPGIRGMHDTSYPRRSALCLETQCFPDTPQNPYFPDILLKKGEIYNQVSIYQFSIVS